MMSETIAIVQAGGPTPVLNASLAGFLEEAKTSPAHVIGFSTGIEGLVKGWTVNLDELSRENIQALKYQPGAALGAGRFPLKDEDFAQIRHVLDLNKVGKLVFVGGNGTMWAAAQVAKAVPEVQVVGLPKTVDNDLWGTDHAPGYLSAAKFVAEGVRSLALDLWSMRNFEQVRVVEVMGRNVGWLAAAASLVRTSLPGFSPLLIYPPEQALDTQKFQIRIQDLLRTEPCILVVVSEGVRDENGRPLGEGQIGGNKGQKILGGASQYLVEELRQTGIPSRYENLGILQRANTWTVCARDREEAITLGRETVRVLQTGGSSVMLGLATAGGASEVQTVPLAEVAGRERLLEKQFLTSDGISDSFPEWLENRLGEPLADKDSAHKVWSLAKSAVK